MRNFTLLSIAGIASLALCFAAWAGSGDSTGDLSVAELSEVFTVAGGRTPRLSLSGNGLLLSWQQVNGKITQLNYAQISGNRVGLPHTAMAGENWLINYADYAMVSNLGNDYWLAAWLVRSEKGLPDYHFKIAQSFDAGKHWSTATKPFSGPPVGQQGFVSALSTDKGALLTWIGSHDKRYALYSGHLDKQGRWSRVFMVDRDNCSCCHPEMARIGAQTAVVYRDRSSEEIRDIAISFKQSGGWSEPRIVAEDGWRMSGCPVNGPALVSLGQSYAVAWFSAPSDKSRIRVKAVSADGRSQVIRLDDENVLGYIDAVAIDAENVLIGWLSGTRNIQLSLQRLDLKHFRLGPRRKLSLPDLRLGFPSLAVSDDRVWIAYESTDNRAQLLSANVAWLD